MKYIGVGEYRSTDRTRELVNQVLDSNRLSHGPLCAELEKKWAELHGCRYGILASSGTDALIVAIQVLKELRGWKNGDEVIVPSATFCATSNSVLLNNLVPVLVDVEDGYYGIDCSAIEAAITSRTRAILTVHLFGQPCNYEVVGIAHDYDLALLEDSCETAFVGHKDRMVGSWGELAAFSQYVCHLVTTGVGGVVTTNREEYALKARSLANHGRDAGIYWNMDNAKNCSVHRLKEVIGRRFKFESVGHSSRLTEIQAAVGLPQVDNWKNIIAIRNYNAFDLRSELSRFEDRISFLELRPDTTCAWMMFPIVCKQNERQRMTHFLESHGIETRDTPSLLNQPVYKDMFDPIKYPIAVKLINRAFYIGCHNYLEQEDLDYIVDIFTQYFNQYPTGA